MPGVKKRKRPDSDHDPEVSFNNNGRKRLRLGINEDQPAEVKPRKSPNGYILPDPLPQGLTLTDLRGRRWTVGSSVGIGGFGEIYSASSLSQDNPKIKPNQEYVIKVEPHSNGPLFVETHFYLRCASKDAIREYQEQRGLDHLGIPHLEGSGSFWFNGKKFRFLVIPRYGSDLQTLLDESGSALSIDTACQMAIQIIDSYEYIHSLGYVHKDVKGSNLLFKQSSRNEKTCPGRRMYLVDFGLASKYRNCGIHKPFVRDERSAHEGTLEYNSRDSHLGCFSRRGDIEVLFYNLVDWMGGKLPWDKPHFVKPKIVEEGKIQGFSNCPQFLEKAFKGQDYPDLLLQMMEYIKSLEFEDQPDYNYLKSLLTFTSSVNSSMDEVSLSMEITKRDIVKVPSPLIIKKSLRRSLRNAKLPLDDNAISIEEEIAQNLTMKSKESKQRFFKQWEHHLHQNLKESMKNPTPCMETRLRKIAGRDPVKSINGHSRSQSKSPARSNDRRKCSKSPRKLMRSKSEHLSNPRTQQHDVLDSSNDGQRLLRSQRRLSEDVDTLTKRSSFRQNLKHFITSVTRSILRIPNEK